MDVFGNAFSSALSNLFNAVPAILGALVILLVFWIVAGILGKLVSKVAQKAKFDTVPGRIGLDKYMRDAGITAAPSQVLGGFVKWFVRLLGISAAVNSLGLTQVSVFLQEILAYLPNVLVAVIIAMLGIWIAQFVGRVVTTAATAARFSNAVLVGRLAHYALLFFVGLIVLDQLKVGSAIVIGLWSAVAGGLALALAIAVGLGGREAAQSYLTGRMLAQDLKPGMAITAGNVSGRISKVGAHYTTLITTDGQLKVPNNQLTQATLKVLAEPTVNHTAPSVRAEAR